jgi:hypothetical protein
MRCYVSEPNGLALIRSVPDHMAASPRSGGVPAGQEVIEKTGYIPIK